MAPFRNRDRSNRSGRGQVEHNVLEGLPINQYREVEITIGNNSLENKQVDKDAWPELPMPRDSHLLPEHSQQILRAARSGRTYKPPAPPEEENENVDEENEHKEVPTGFTVKKWTKVPRHLEEPEPEYLAKRRKGLPSQYAVGAVSTQPMAMRETKVKKTDAEGNVVVYKALVPEGQAVEGEVQETDAVVEAAPIVAAPGTVVEGVGIVNAEGVVVANDIMQQTPPRRKPPPPKKKKRSGPGRGRKKVVFVEGAAEQGTPSGISSDLLAIPGNKQDGSVEPSEGGDTPMPDAGDEGEDSGEEGSDDDENDERSHSPTPADDIKSKTPPTSAPAVELPKETVVEDVLMKDASPPPASTKPTSPAAPVETKAPTPPQPEQEQAPKVARDSSSSPEMPLISHSRQNSTSQVPTLDSLNNTAEAPIEAKAVSPLTESAAPVSPPAAEKVSTPQQPVPVEPEPTSVESKAEEPKADVPGAAEPKAENTEAPESRAVEPQASEPIATDPTTAEPQAEDPKVMESEPPELKTQEPETIALVTTEPTATAPEPATDKDETDILGSLEAHLEKDQDNASKGEP